MGVGIALDFVAALIDAAALLIYLLGWVVALGLLYTWNATFHYILQKIASALTFHVGISGVFSHTFHLGGWANDIDTFARNALSDWAVGCEIIVGKLFYVMGWIVYETIHETQALAKDTLDLGKWLVHTFVPAYVHGVTDLIHTGTRVIHTTTTVVERKVTNLTKTVTATADHAVTVLDRELAALRHRVLVDERTIYGLAHHGIDDIGHLLKRLRKVEGLLGAAAFAAAMANVLGLPNWRCLTRGNIGKVARRLCGLGPQALEDLLGLLVDVLLVEDVCQVVTLLEDGLHLIQGPLDSIVGVVGGSLCHGDYSAPPDLAALPLSLPPVTGLAALAA